MAMDGADYEAAARVDALVDAATAIRDDEAKVNITFAGQQGDLPDPVSRDATDEQVREWVTEAVRAGGVPGIDADPSASFQDFVVDRFDAKDGMPSRISVRPKTPFGVLGGC